jgi:hypothetical protein
VVRRRRYRLGLLLGIMLLGALLRFTGIRFGLSLEFARPDEERITAAALRIMEGDFDPHFFLYPTFFIYQTAAVSALLPHTPHVAAELAVEEAESSSGRDPRVVRLVARVLSATSGVLTIAVLCGAALELFSWRIALTAAALLAVAFLHVRDSHFGVTDVPATFVAVCAFWSAVRLASRGLSAGRIAAAGLLCGLAASTKYNLVFVAAPAMIAVALQTARSWPNDRAATVRFLAIFTASLTVGFLVATPYSLLDRPGFLADFEEQRRAALGVDRSPILDDARRILSERGWLHHAVFSLRYGVGLPMWLSAVAGAVWLAFARPARAGLVLSFPLLFYAVMGTSTLAYARWVVPLVPFICLMAALWIAVMADAATRVLRTPGMATIVTMILTIAVAAPTASEAWAFDRLVQRTDARELGARWIEARHAAGATVYQTGRRYGHLEPLPGDRYPAYDFDERSGRFKRADGLRQEETAWPDLVIVLDAPLAIFNRVPERLQEVLDRRYELMASFQGIGGGDEAGIVYDQQDAFYVPFAGSRRVKRPGPTVRIFERRQ